jgi:hypothetical protein
MVAGRLEETIDSRIVQGRLRTLVERRGEQAKDMVIQVTRSFLLCVVDRAN